MNFGQPSLNGGGKRGLWLVTGAAGYIGSAVGAALLKSGYGVIGLDDFSTGRTEHVATLPRVVSASVLERGALFALAGECGPIQGIVHTAGKKRPGESVLDPLTYFEVNVVGTLRVLELATKFQVPNLIFSSSCSVYGNRDEPAREDSLLRPSSPYAVSKMTAEDLIRSTAISTGLRTVSLRFFNVVGRSAAGSADWSLSNIVPALSHAALAREQFTVNGTDFATRDGTCVRDYVHVDDIAEAHLRVADRLAHGHELPSVINLGTRAGLSVREVVELFMSTTGESVRVAEGSRREGDPASSLADSSLAASTLDWHPTYSVESALLSAWEVYSNVNQPQWIPL